MDKGNRNLALAIGMAMTAMVFQPAIAAPQANGGFQIRATVPMACWIEHIRPADALEGVSGAVKEGCNSASGYLVSASYRSLASTENARLLYDGAAVSLSHTGMQEIRRVRGAQIRTLSYSFDRVTLKAPLTLSFMVQPI